jgi:uncharacterized cupredoxin-like copper-binding protein
MRNAVTALLFSSLLLLGAACTDEKPNENRLGTTTDTTGAASQTADATHPASPGGAAVVPGVDAGTTVLVMIQEGSIAVREQAIPPGPAVLTIENRGTDVHNLFIEGEGISRAAGDTIAANGSASVDVNFRPGTYTLYCPLGDHRQKGEQVEVTIAAPGGGTAAGTNPS